MSSFKQGQQVYVTREALSDYRLNPQRALGYDGQVAILVPVDKHQTSFAWKAVYDDGFNLCVDENELITAVECPRCNGDGQTWHFQQWFSCGLCSNTGYVSDIAAQSYIEDAH